MHRVGLIGLGIMGTYMFKEFMKDPRFRVTAVWDLDTERCRQIQGEFPHIETTTDAQALISRDDVDVVYIATPPRSHVAYCHLALDHNKTILCEKPLSTDEQAAAELVERARKLSIPHALNFLFGEMHTVRTLYQAVKSGEAGELTSVDIRMHFPQWPRAWQKAGNWLQDKSEGGFVREVLSHYVFLTDLLCGSLTLNAKHVTYPREANSFSSGTEIGVSAVMQSDHVPLHFMGTLGGRAPEHIEYILYGTKQSYRILNWTTLQVSTGDSWQTVNTSAPPAPLDELHRMLSGEDHLLADFAAGLRVQTIIEGIVG